MNKYFVIPIFMMVATVGQAQSFTKTKMVSPGGIEVPVELRFDKKSQSMTVKTLKGSVIEVPYDRIAKLSYEQSAHHRVKEGAIVMLASFGAGGVVMLTKSKVHWLYVEYKEADGQTKDLTLKLDKSQYRDVLGTAKEHTGRDVETRRGNYARSKNK